MKTTTRSSFRLRPALALAAALAASSTVGALPVLAQMDSSMPAAIVTGGVVTPDLIVSQDLNRADAVNARLATRIVTAKIAEADFASRDEGILLAQRGASDGRAIVASLRAGARTLSESASKDMESAVLKSDQARDRLNQAISKARESSTEERWKIVREELAERYEQFATALEEAREVAVEGGVRFEPLVVTPATATTASGG